jgi:hypothetical protein
MSHRFTTWWRALSVVLLSLATVTWPSAAQAATTPRLIITHQNALTTLSSSGVTHFATTLTLKGASGKATANVTLYPALVTESEISAIVANTGSTATPLASTGTFALDCIHREQATFSVSIYTSKLKSPLRSCQGVTPRLRLGCVSTGCSGVYPLRYQVDINGTNETKWSLLAIKSSPITNPLNVALVQTITRDSLQHPLRSISDLNTISHFASLPLTLSDDYETLASIDFNPTGDATWRAALNKSLVSPLHRAVVAPPNSIDLAGLARYGLTTQVPQQLSVSANVLKSLTGRYVDSPVLLSGAQTPASLDALAHAGVSDVVLPEGDLTQAPSSTLTWGAPFRVAGAGTITAQSVDGPVSNLMAETSIEPGRRAALTLASLAFLHLEEPNAPATRTLVIEANIGTTSQTFEADLLNGLKNDPFSKLVPLTPSFNSSLIGSNNAPATRALNTSLSTASAWSTHNVSSLLTLIGAVNSYAQGVKSSDEALVLRVAVARSEILGNSNQRQSAINAANNQLNAQVGQFSIDESAITLAGQGTSLPITVISRAPYTVDAVIHLVTDRVTFPKGDAVPVTMNSPTQSIRVPTSSPHGSSLTLQVVLTTPNGHVILARSAIQVRIAGTSVVGYLLSFGSILVLALWWWRTNRKRPKGLHAR